MNKKLIIALIATIAVVVTGVVGFTVVKGIMIKSDPVNYMVYSMTHNSHSAVDTSFSANFDVDDEALATYMSYYSTEPEAMAELVSKMLARVSIDGNVKSKFDMDEKELSFYESVQLSYSNKSVLDMYINMQDEQMLIGSEMAMEKPLGLTKAELFDYIYEMNGIDLSKVDLDKYMDLLDMKDDAEYKKFLKNGDEYQEILKKHLDNFEKDGKEKIELSNGDTVKCDIIEGDLSLDEMMELYIDLLEEIKNDDELKELIQAKAVEMIELAISSKDYEVLGVEKEVLKSLIDSIDTEFDAAYEEGIDTLISTYSEALYSMSEVPMDDLKYNIRIAIDRHYDIRQVVLSMDIMGFAFEQTVTMNAFDGDVKFDKMPKADDTVRLLELAEDPYMAETFGTDLVATGLTNILESDVVDTFMEDLEKDSESLSEDTRMSIMSLVDYFKTNRDSLKDMLLQMMGL